MKISHREAEAQRRAEFKCPCGKITCGVGKNKGEMTRDFLAWAGDEPHTRSVDRKVRQMVPAYLGHRGR